MVVLLFDSSVPSFLCQVKGLVARPVTVKDAESATALEVVAGNKLFQVVVDDELTAKALLQKGSLRRRVTVIPLNKISRQVSSPCRELLFVVVSV